MVECRTRDPEVPGSNPFVAKKKNLSQVQSEQYHHQSLCTRVKYLKLSEVPEHSEESKMEIPLRAKPTHYMNIYDGTNKTKPKEIAQCLFQGVHFLIRAHARE